MAQTPEGRVKAAIKAFLKTLPNCWFFMAVPYGYGVNGVPDIVGCYRGVFFAIEVKAPGKLGNVTSLQQIAINAINNAHGYAIATDNVGRVQDMFDVIDAKYGFARRV